MKIDLKVSKLGELGKVSMCKRVLKHQTSENGDIPFYKISTFGGKSDTYISKELYQSFRDKYSYPKIGDILISAAGTIGKTVVFDGEPSYFQDSNIVWIANDESEVINQFLYYYYLTEPWIATNGSTIKRLYNDNIRNLTISYPDISFQKQIAKILSDLDAKIEVNNKINQELEDMAKTLYDYWFVQFDFPDANGKPYKSSGGKMVYNEKLKREIPEGWEVKKLSKCSKIIDCLHSKKSDYLFENEECYLLQLENITQDNLIDLSKKYYVSKEEYERWTTRIEVEDGDLVITNAGRVAGLAQIPMSIKAGIGRNITAIRPSEIKPTFLYYTFQGAEMERQIKLNTDTGSFFKSLNVRGIKELLVVRPPKYFEEKFENISINHRRKRELNSFQNQKLAELRDWLLPMLMNGQVTVGEEERDLTMAAVHSTTIQNK